jgi:diguanylate cyclase (GGDEF)-like protein
MSLLMTGPTHGMCEDPVSGLADRRSFDDHLHALVADGCGIDAALVLLDVDGFKRINDAYGLQGGDDVLCQIGAALADELRPGDFAARLGADEFGLILRSTSPAEATGLAQRVRAAVRDRVRPGVTLSVGVTGCHGGCNDAMMRAQMALYRVKRGGRDNVVAA